MKLLLTTVALLLSLGGVGSAQTPPETVLPTPRAIDVIVGVELIDLRVSLQETPGAEGEPAAKTYQLTAEFRLRLQSGNYVHKSVQVPLSQIPAPARQALRTVHDELLAKFMQKYGLN